MKRRRSLSVEVLGHVSLKIVKFKKWNPELFPLYSRDQSQSDFVEVVSISCRDKLSDLITRTQPGMKSMISLMGTLHPLVKLASG